MPSLAPHTSVKNLLMSLIWPVYAPATLTSAAQSAILVLLPLYVLELGYGESVAALMLASRGVGQLLGDLPAGMMVARWGDKICLITGSLCYAVGYSLIAIGISPWLMGVGGVIAGIGMSLSIIGRQAYVTHRAAISQRGRVVSVMAGMMRVGSLIGPLLGGLAAHYFGYTETFVALVAVCLASAMVVAISAEKGEPEADKTPHSLTAIFSVLVDFKSQFLTAGVTMVSLQFMRAARIALIPLAGNALGLSVAEIGFIASAGAAVDSLMFIPAGIIMDRWGRKYSAAPSLLFFALGLVWLGWADTHTGLLGAAMLIGFGNGLSAGLVMVLGSDFAPQQGRARFLGVWKLVADSGQAGSPLVISGVLTFASLLACSHLIAASGVFGLYVMATRMQETLVKQDPHRGVER